MPLLHSYLSVKTWQVHKSQQVAHGDSRCVLASLVYALGKGNCPVCHLVFPAMTMDCQLCPADKSYVFHILVFPLNMSIMVSVSSYFGICVISQPECHHAQPFLLFRSAQPLQVVFTGISKYFLLLNIRSSMLLSTADEET